VDASNSETHLSGVQTLWSQLRLAHGDAADAGRGAPPARGKRKPRAVRP
jgi:hypothetical protein